MNIKNRMDADLAFKQVEKMLYALAWRAAKTQGLDFEDCLSECYYAFVKALNWRYNPKRNAKFSTCVYTIASWRLKNLAIKRIRAIPMLELNEEIAGAAPPQRSETLELVEGLSEDAREIIALLLETPGEILREGPIPVSRLLGKVKHYLVGKGRSTETLDNAHMEIQTVFRQEWANA